MRIEAAESHENAAALVSGGLAKSALSANI
jgi:hypothetical protein